MRLFIFKTKPLEGVDPEVVKRNIERVNRKRDERLDELRELLIKRKIKNGTQEEFEAFLKERETKVQRRRL